MGSGSGSGLGLGLGSRLGLRLGSALGSALGPGSGLGLGPGLGSCRGGAEGEPRGVCLRVPAEPPRAGENPQQATCTKGAERVKGRPRVGPRVRLCGAGKGSWRTDRPRATRGADADEEGGVGPLSAGTGASLHRASLHRLRASQHRAVGMLSTAPAPAGATCRGEPACRPFGPTDATDPILCSTCRTPPPRPPRASTPSAAGGPRLQKS